jgi:o-succinylbenzoate synthase
VRIVRSEVSVHHGRMRRAVRNARARWSERIGALLILEDGSGRCGVGEASPLPGRSSEGLADVVGTLEALDWRELGEIDLASPLAEAGRASARVPSALPSARFAVETAVLDLAAKASGRPLSELVARCGSGGIPESAALVDGESPRAAVEGALAAVAAGFRTLKLKLGGGAFEADLAKLDALRSALPGGVRVRVDFNGTIEADALEGHLRALARFEPELVEEPSALEAIERLEATPVAIALDESLEHREFETRIETRIEDLAKRGLIAALVLKPMLLGGVVRTLELAAIARSLGLGAIISHAFDGPRAFEAYRALARAIGDRRFAQGLAPHEGLEALS